MASKVAAPQPTLEQISALAEIERARSRENDKTVKQVARKYLGHIYNKETNQIEEIVVENYTDESFVREDSNSLYVATLDATKETALHRLNNTFGFNIAATVPAGPVPFKIEGGLDVGRTKTDSSDSSTVFCAVACVKKDRCGFQKVPKRLDVESESVHVGIIKSILVYAGYRVVLEIISNKNKSEKKTTVGVKAEGSTLSTVLGAGIKFNHENSSLADRNIEQINIKEIISFGGYRVPSMQIPQGNDFPKIQEMFENIREHFELNYYSLVDRLILVHPTEDLVPFREITSSSSGTVLPLSSELQPLKTSVTPRNLAYYRSLAEEILPLLSESERNFLYHRVRHDGYRGTDLGLGPMLYGIEIAFSNLLKLGIPSSRPVLLVGADSSILRNIGVRLMGGITQTRRMSFPNNQFKDVTEYLIPSLNPSTSTSIAEYLRPGQVSRFDFSPDIFNPESNITISGINSYGKFLESPILTNELFPGHIPAEYDLCLGVATDFMMFLGSAPKKVIVGIPQDFFKCSKPSDLAKKLIALFESLRRIVFNPVSSKESILFVFPDGHGIYDNVSEEIQSAKKTLLAEKANRETKGGGLFDKLKASLFGNVESMTNMKDLAEIEEALEAYAFIVSRLAGSSEVQAFFREDGSYNHFKLPFVDLSPQNFDRQNITLNSSFFFEMVVTIALRYMRYVENKVANLESQSLTSLGLLRSYDRILTLLKQKEIGKIDKAEAETSLGTAITQELEKWVTTKQKKEEQIRDNTKYIEAKRTKIEEWEKDTTPTPLTLTSNERITMRSFWRLPGLGKEYTFQTSYEFSKCEFSQTSGSFNCIEAEFINTKKAVFTPKHWGYENDLQAYVKIWMEKRKHPETLKDIENYRADIKQLEETDKSLKKELKEIDDAIHEFTAKNIKVIEGRLTEKKAAFSTLSSELDRFRSKLIQHHEYYQFLKGVPAQKTGHHTTNYYGLTPVLDSFIPGTQDLSKELSLKRALEEVQSRMRVIEGKSSYIKVREKEEEQSLLRALEEERFRMSFQNSHSLMRTLSEQKRRPIYLITPENLGDQCFGADYAGDPIFFEYDGKDYRGLEPGFGQKPQEIAKEIKLRRA